MTMRNTYAKKKLFLKWSQVMVIVTIFFIFMLNTVNSEEKIQVETESFLKNSIREKPTFKHFQFNLPTFQHKFSSIKHLQAEAKNNNRNIKVLVGAGIPTEDSFNTYVVSGFGLTIPLKKRLLLCFDGGFWKSAVDEIPAKFYDGHLKAFPFMVSLQFSLFRQNRINPYFFFGTGYIFTSFTMKNIITIPEININQRVKNGPFLQGGVGIDITVSHSWGVFSEAAYFYREATGITTITNLNFRTNTREFPTELHAWIFRIGIKYFIK